MTMKKVNSIRRCRLCACEDSFNTFFNIFDDNPELELDIKITKLLPVVVMPWDPMPHLICPECIMKLNAFNDFYEASVKAEKFLRTFHPSVPEHELENLDPVVRLIDPMKNGTPLNLPPKKRAESKRKQSAEATEFIQERQEPSRGKDEPPKPVSNCFIVNQITSRDSIYTCRNCFRTFTKQSSALTHSCVRLEDCDDLGTIGVNGEGAAAGKSLPPLKIRLFSVRSGLYICYLCQNPFELKSELVDHLKGHFDDENWENETGKRGRPRRSRKVRQSYAEDFDWEDSLMLKPTKPRKRKCSTAPKKRGRQKKEVQQQMGACEKCGKPEESFITSTPVKETMEQTTQCSEIPNFSEELDVDKTMDKNSQVSANPIADAEPSKTPPETPAVEARAVDETETAKENSPTTTIVNPDENLLTLEEDKAPEKDWNSEEPIVLSVEPPAVGDNKADEVTVLEVVNNRTPTIFSSCIFCDKIFATKEALIAHQNKHLQGFAGLKGDAAEGWRTTDVRPLDEETFLCSVCAMKFTCRKTLLEHEQFHQVDGDSVGGKRKIRIALTPQEPEMERQISNGRGVITITVTAGEKKIPQIELI